MIAVNNPAAVPTDNEQLLDRLLQEARDASYRAQDVADEAIEVASAVQYVVWRAEAALKLAAEAEEDADEAEAAEAAGVRHAESRRAEATAAATHAAEAVQSAVTEVYHIINRAKSSQGY